MKPGHEVTFRCENVACDGHGESYTARVDILDGYPDGQPRYRAHLAGDGLESDRCPFCGQQGECMSDLSRVESEASRGD